ncbi:nitroreductase/quinone reductase family protein, partial [Streptomyces sp. T-3]|nr:nitroreductase/quinone reductase family protein [Streptomyces sp. T-3]
AAPAPRPGAGPAEALPETTALTSWATTKPQLNASPLTKAFVRFNVYLYSKPPSKARHSINKFFLRLNVWVYRQSKGRYMGKFGDLEALLLTTRGRKTGQKRTTPVAFQYVDGCFIIVAVPGHFDIPGGPKASHPAWYLNLRAVPEANIDIGPEQIDVTAVELTGHEREDRWRGFTDAYPFIGEFAKRARRPLPLLKLVPKDLDPQGP